MTYLLAAIAIIALVLGLPIAAVSLVVWLAPQIDEQDLEQPMKLRPHLNTIRTQSNGRRPRGTSVPAGVVEIPLTCGYTTVVDAADWPLVSHYKWCVKDGSRCPYAVTGIWVPKENWTRIVRMQRLIMNAPEGLVVDHIDGDTLNNVRSNLRLCTQRQNQFNRRGKRNSSSRFRGVNLHRRHWRAEIFCLDGSRKYLGSFDNEVDAARAWNAAAIVEHGEFARLNVIEE